MVTLRAVAESRCSLSATVTLCFSVVASVGGSPNLYAQAQACFRPQSTLQPCQNLTTETCSAEGIGRRSKFTHAVCASSSLAKLSE